jgi:hypothetical protein
MTIKYTKPTNHQFKDLTGKIFHYLNVNKFVYIKAKAAWWECACKCGNIVNVKSSSLSTGNTRSCGCLQKEVVAKLCYKHGGNGTPEFATWQAMLARCRSSNPIYGGRGIKVCDRWVNNFENFLADMGKKPTPKHSIDRINSNGDYTPENCRWATAKEQLNNTNRNVKVSYLGKTLSIAQWAEYLGINERTLRNRYNRGSPLHEVFSIDPLPRRNKTNAIIKIPRAAWESQCTDIRVKHI